MNNSFQFIRKRALACVGLLAVTSAASSAPARLAPRSWITTDPLVYPTADASHPVAGVKDHRGSDAPARHGRFHPLSNHGKTA